MTRKTSQRAHFPLATLFRDWVSLWFLLSHFFASTLLLNRSQWTLSFPAIGTISARARSNSACGAVIAYQPSLGWLISFCSTEDIMVFCFLSASCRGRDLVLWWLSCCHLTQTGDGRSSPTDLFASLLTEQVVFIVGVSVNDKQVTIPVTGNMPRAQFSDKRCQSRGQLADDTLRRTNYNR